MYMKQFVAPMFSQRNMPHCKIQLPLLSSKYLDARTAGPWQYICDDCYTKDTVDYGRARYMRVQHGPYEEKLQCDLIKCLHCKGLMCYCR